MQKLKDMPSVGKLPLLRHCQEVQIVIFPLFWDLHLQKIRRYWDCVLSMIRKESIMEGSVAAPVIRGIFENVLPYLGIEKSDVLIYLQKAIQGNSGRQG